MSETDKVKRPKFTLEFKQDAAKLVLEKGYTHQQAADSLGVSLSALGRWVRAERSPAALSGTKAQAMNLADHDELVRLRKENEQLRMEREIIIPTGHKKRPQSSLRKNSGEVRIHPRATEDLSCHRIMQSDGRQYQCLL